MRRATASPSSSRPTPSEDPLSQDQHQQHREEHRPVVAVDGGVGGEPVVFFEGAEVPQLALAVRVGEVKIVAVAIPRLRNLPADVGLLQRGIERRRHHGADVVDASPYLRAGTACDRGHEALALVDQRALVLIEMRVLAARLVLPAGGGGAPLNVVLGRYLLNAAMRDIGVCGNECVFNLETAVV